ncbi:MAG TPA: FAD-containing oxidoreductase [Bryobacteraceae bacterium]|jgi:pyruvate/2-oxoglutarate dehydrogenase complex dihydrolipoamide dehydrogenase (E3) component
MTDSSNRFDAIIIGTGQAGPFLADRLTAVGKKVAIIERGKFGGTCVNTGCIPTKTMVASAYAAHMVRRAADFGIEVPGQVAVDMKKVKARKDEISNKSRLGTENHLKNLPNCTVFQGHGRFQSPREVRVGDETLSAEKIFINVGGRATIPSISGLEEIEYLTNSSMMEVDFLPRHLIILGGSYIGLEFGQMFRRFGSEVTILETGPRLIGHEDEDVSDAIREIVELEGIDIRLNSKCNRIAKKGNDIIVSLETGGQSSEVRGSHFLVAAGRRPNTDDLDLEKAGVAADERGYIQVDDQLRTNVDGIWALGDCNGKGGFTHTSYNDFEVVAANLLDNDPRRVSDRILAYNLYIDPPLGRAGMTERDGVKYAKRTGKQVLKGSRPMTKVGRAVEKGETLGFMKILIDGESRKILGAAILGTAGDEVIHSILDVMYAGSPYTVIQRAMHIHPTVSELIPTMLGELKPI